MDSDRIKAVTEFTRDIAVDASAGTGKTATLIARVLNLFLADPVLLPDRVLLLTFTDKAAAEMKSRVVEGLELLLNACRSAATLGEVREKAAAWNSLVRIPGGGEEAAAALRERVEELADGVGRLSVTTFHSFCRRILLSFPAEAGVDPKFEVLAEGEASDAWDNAFTAFLREEFGGREIDPSWERVLHGPPGPEAVWSAIRRLCLSQRDLLTAGELDFGTAADFLGYTRAEYADAVEWFRAFVEGIADPAHEMTPVLSRALGMLERVWTEVSGGDISAVAAQASEAVQAFEFRADRTRSRKIFPQPPGFTLAQARDNLQRFLREISEAPAGDAAARFLVDRARAALGHYRKAKGSGLDFMDLLLRANDLLAGSREVAKSLSERFRYVFVDEFQDTDPLQAEMLERLSSNTAPGRLFVVGDPKQSIYGFRRADIQVYAHFRESMLSRGGEGIALVSNFRSRPDLLSSVNGLFGQVLSGGEDFSPGYAPVKPNRQDPGGGFPVTSYTLGEEATEAEFVCGLVRRIAGNVPVGGKGGAPERAASLRDIAVLYRSDAGGEALAGFRDAFARAGIPLVVPPRKGFYSRQEIQDLRIVLSAVDAPADLSARYAALKTIFFGLRDEEILPLHEDGGPPPGEKVRDALGLLGRLSAERGRASLSNLLAGLYAETGVEFVAARHPDGDRIVRNLAKAAGMARAFEWTGGGSVKAFLADLKRKTEEDRQESEFPAFDEGEDAVQVSTIHASKGLEFPIVILANLSRGGRKRVEGLRVDRRRKLSAVIFPGFRTYSAFRRIRLGERMVTFEEWEQAKQNAEEVRLFYVAATRARDRLYLVKGAKGKGSIQWDALRQGLACASDGGPGKCAVTGISGTRRLFPGGGEMLDVAVSESPAVEPSPPSVTFDLSFVREWPTPPPEPIPPLPEPLSLKEYHDREKGKRFGEKVHMALEAFPPAGSPWPPREPLPPAVSWGEGEEARWIVICRKIAASAFFKEIREMSLVGTEVPLLACSGGMSNEERADLIVRMPVRPGNAEKTGAEHWVVDYKTGRREKDSEEDYIRQVRRYSSIVAEAWRVPARAFIWYVETGEAVEV
ncbi:MAG: UvrD-helicase domain-containing protein [Deltaproteobacteria bacterium]|nr:UvrD-helicase domain-containing protein [Deltaproteobacteria bacterium]